MFSIAGQTAPCVTPCYQPSAWRLGSVAMSRITIYGIQRFTLSQIYLFYRLFLHLANVSQFYSSPSVYPFVSYLWPTSRTSSFILCSSTIKTHVHRISKTENPPQTWEIIFGLRPTLSLHHTFVQLRLMSHYFAWLHPTSPYITLHHIKSHSFRNPPYTPYPLYLITRVEHGCR
jgi:hypothetical protein